MVTALEEIGQTALDYSPGTDADGFAVRQETADELSLETMSDLAGVADQLVWDSPRDARTIPSAALPSTTCTASTSARWIPSH